MPLNPLSRRSLLKASLTTAATAFVANAAQAAVRGLRVTRHTVPWAGPEPLRLVHITDVHVGWATPRRVLQAVAETAHDLRPTATVLTGDYVNHSLKHLDRVESFVGSLPGPVFATLGNHDYWAGAGSVVDTLRASGATVLINESAPLGPLTLVGVDDGFTGHHDPDRALAGVDPSRAVVLSHLPNTADAIAELGGELVLSGHTHGGQISIPGVTKLVGRAVGISYMAGWYQLDGAQLYVNAGCGQSFEGLRAGQAARPEVAVFDLVPVNTRA